MELTGEKKQGAGGNENAEAQKLVSEAKKTVGLLTSLKNTGKLVAEKVKIISTSITSFYQEKKDFDEYSEQLEKTFEQLGNDCEAKLLEARNRNDRQGEFYSTEVLEALESEYTKARTRMEKTYGARSEAKTKRSEYERVIVEVKSVPEKVMSEIA
ncbi:hypothetical protein HY992_03485 [Candidatus Micrarchaeota archaeon]|nr:hypothetical protein [Candidatus Micrarchaeota archaeon]